MNLPPRVNLLQLKDGTFYCVGMPVHGMPGSEVVRITRFATNYDVVTRLPHPCGEHHALVRPEDVQRLNVKG